MCTCTAACGAVRSARCRDVIVLYDACGLAKPQADETRKSALFDEVQRGPTRGAFLEGEAGAGGEGLQAQLGVVDGIRQADLPMLQRVITAELHRGLERRK